MTGNCKKQWVAVYYIASLHDESLVIILGEKSMRSCFQLILFPCLVFAPDLSAAPDSSGELQVVPDLDLNRYTGVWYEIARLPNEFQKMCAGNVTATYDLLEDGSISVTNKCTESDGSERVAEGRARLVDREGPNSKLEVRFAPWFLSFLPFVWGDYWVIELAADYSYSVVGHPDRTYLWILSRTPQMEESTFERILDSVEKQGYDPAELVKTDQSGNITPAR